MRQVLPFLSSLQYRVSLRSSRAPYVSYHVPGTIASRVRGPRNTDTLFGRETGISGCAGLLEGVKFSAPKYVKHTEEAEDKNVLLVFSNSTKPRQASPFPGAVKIRQYRSARDGL